jgi:hypothetical protein
MEARLSKRNGIQIMKIRITTTPPLEQQHGITIGREFEVKSTVGRGYKIRGDKGELCLILDRECETVIEDSEV